jgi:nucleoside-diphosphate-sugar epimerase
MKVLVVGASGFIGRHVLNQLVGAGIDSVVVGRTCPTGYTGDFVEADLLEAEGSKNLIQRAGASHLIHLAWYAEHGAYWTSPLNLRWVDATVRLTEAFCLAGGKQMVLAGTCAEYDWSYGYCTETNTPLKPATLYGIAKDATRRLVTAVCAEYQVPCAWGRIFLPYGPGEDSRRLIPALIDVFEGKRVPFGVNATAFRDFLHVEDVAAGFLTLLQGGAGGAFNICSSQPVQIAEVVKLLAKQRTADPQLILSLNTERPCEPPLLVGDNKKIMQLGWRAKHSLSELALRRSQNYE